MIPHNEQPTEEELEGYVPKYPGPPDIAWGRLYPQLCAWLADREARKAKDAESSNNDSGIGQFNYQR